MSGFTVNSTTFEISCIEAYSIALEVQHEISVRQNEEIGYEERVNLGNEERGYE